MCNLSLHAILKCYHYCAESYNNARSKLRQAEETSALDTEAEEVATMKSRQKRKKVWTDEENVEPETPPLKMRQCKRSSDNVRATAALPAVPASLQSQSSGCSKSHKSCSGLCAFGSYSLCWQMTAL